MSSATSPLAGQIDEARKHGYSDDDIVGYLGKKRTDLAPKFAEAKRSGYASKDVLDHLAKAHSQPPGAVQAGNEIGQNVRDFGKGVGKQLVKRAIDFTEVLASIPVAGAPIKAALATPDAQKARKATEPTNTAQKAGRMAEETAEFAIPGEAEEAAASGAARLGAKGGKLLSKVAEKAVRGASAGVVSASQTGSLKEGAKTAALVGPLSRASAAKGIAKEAVDETTKRIAKLAKEVPGGLGTTTSEMADKPRTLNRVMQYLSSYSYLGQQGIKTRREAAAVKIGETVDKWLGSLGFSSGPLGSGKVAGDALDSAKSTFKGEAQKMYADVDAKAGNASTAAPQPPEASASKPAADVTYRVRDNPHGIFVEALNKDGKVVGGATFDRTENGLKVQNLNVDKDLRRQGIASKLYDLAKENHKAVTGKEPEFSTGSFQTDSGKAFRESYDKRGASTSPTAGTAGGILVSTDTLKKAIGTEENKVTSLENVGIKRLSKPEGDASKVFDDARSVDPDVSFSDAQHLRSELTDMLRKDNQDPKTRRVAAIALDNLNHAMETAAKKEPGLWKAYQAANDFYRHGMETFENEAVAQLMKRNPETLANSVGKGQVSNALAIRRAMTQYIKYAKPEDAAQMHRGFDAFRDQWVRTQLLKTPERGAAIDLAGLKGRLQEMKGPVQALFRFDPKSRTMMRNLDTLGEAISRMQKIGEHGLARLSETAAIGGGMTSALIAMFTGHAGAAGEALAAGTAGVAMGEAATAAIVNSLYSEKTLNKFISAMEGAAKNPTPETLDKLAVITRVLSQKNQDKEDKPQAPPPPPSSPTVGQAPTPPGQ